MHFAFRFFIPDISSSILLIASSSVKLKVFAVR